MPTYEYRCTKGHQFEVVQSFSDDPVTKCPTCGAKVQRVFHAPAIHFKGSGFHNTDYGTRKRGTDSETTTSTSSDAGSSSSSSSDTKATEKQDSKPADKPAPSKKSD